MSDVYTLLSIFVAFFIKVVRKAKIKHGCNQVPHLTRDTIRESDKTQENTTHNQPLPSR